jgi:hypothetical protein
MKTNQIHVTKVAEVIASTNGKFFTVVFEKLDKTLRTLNGRTGVTKGVKGTQKSPAAHAGNPFKVIWDAQIEAFRMVNLATVRSITFNHTTYEVVR